MTSIVNKRILITNFSIQDYAGSEINTLSLAKVLRDLGADVEIATFNYAYPIREEYDKERLTVTNVLLEELKRKEYDLIWAHHSFVLDYLIWEKQINVKQIIFSSLSAFEALEVLPIYAKELTLCLANSQETRASLREECNEEEEIMVFPNYVDDDMLKEFRIESSQYVRKVAIISNHLPPELVKLIDLLRESEIDTVIYGQGYRQQLVDATLIMQYDLIITIGKTVQYAMALGVPVFCYDIHGGPGYLTQENIDTAYFYNFSGRGGFGKKSAEELLYLILGGYTDACANLKLCRQFVEEHCVLKNNIEWVLEILADAGTLDVELIRKKYSVMRRYNRAFVREYRYNLFRKMELINIEQKNDELIEIKKLVQEMSEKASHILELSNNI